jgi:hypothetical protein
MVRGGGGGEISRRREFVHESEQEGKREISKASPNKGVNFPPSHTCTEVNGAVVDGDEGPKISRIWVVEA